MHQLVGLKGRRYLLLLHLAQFLIFAAVSVFGLFVVLHDQGLISVSPWYASVILVPAYGMFFAVLGMCWWALSAAAARLDQDLFHVTVKRRIIPIFLLVFSGTLISHLWLLLNRLDLGSFAGAGLELVPGGLAWTIGAIALSRYVIRSNVRLRVARQTAPRSDQLVRKLKEEFGEDAVERIEVSHRIFSGRSPANPLASPKGKVLYGLPSKPWYEASEFAWARMLEENFSTIRDEAVGILGNGDPFEPYLYPGVSNGGWTSFSFFRDRKLNEKNCAKCPQTAKLLRELPRYPHFRDAMFSLLEPGREIRLHQDFTNLYLTCHLGIVVPPDGGLEVAGRTRHWEEGKCLIFDPSYAHAAWNHSSERRIVLLIDFLHPDINDAEYAWIKRAGA